MIAKLVKESFFDEKDLEYVPSNGRKSPRKKEVFKESGEDQEKKYVIIGSSEYGVEILDSASTEEEAEELVNTYQISFGKDWTIDWKEESEFNSRDMTDREIPGEKYIILGISDDGEEILETADSEEEAEELANEFEIALPNWEIEYMPESEYKQDEEEMEEDEYDEDEYDEGDNEEDFYDDSIKIGPLK